jgi:hypothetical protein
MATQSSEETLYGAGFSPLRGEPTMGSIPMPTITVTTGTLTTGGGARTLTAAECIGGLVLFNVDDAQSINLPSATLLAAAMPGAAVGQSLIFYIKNIGDATGTVVAGTGGTLSGTATIATLTTRVWLVRLTAVSPDTPTYTAYTLGTLTA